MPDKAEFLKFNTIKAYINDILKMRASESAVKKSLSEFDAAIETVLKEAGELAKQDKRNTIMDQDIIAAVEKHLGKKNLTWQETAEEIIRQNPTDLGKISKAINDYIEKNSNEIARIKSDKRLIKRLQAGHRDVKKMKGRFVG